MLLGSILRCLPHSPITSPPGGSAVARDMVPALLPLRLRLWCRPTATISSPLPINTCSSRPPWALFAARSPVSSRIHRRFFYGHIDDAKMAPQLEPFFKQYARLVSRACVCTLTNPSAVIGWTTRRTHSSIVRADKKIVHLACLFVNTIIGLRAAVAIPSISAADEHRPDVFKVCFVLACHRRTRS
jgi:Cys-Gly metallodipeptidase DUG1